MASKSRKGLDRGAGAAGGKSNGGVASVAKPKPNPVRASMASGRSRTVPVIVGLVVVAAIALGGVFVATRGGSAPSGSGSIGTVVQASNGVWTDISPDRLATELKQHDFTLLNVKTPYIGEIEGTDLYVPYDQLTARASQLPSDKSAKIVVYCRSGAESTIAAQTLLNLGYTNIENLDGGMNAWTAGGRTLVQNNRT